MVAPAPGAGGVRGVGIDVVDLARFRAALERQPTLVDRLFTAAERAYAEGRADPVESFAARFAAKEAVLKALGVGLGACSFRDIEVRREESGRPHLVLQDSAAELARQRGITGWHVSMSHSDLVAEAVAIAL